MTPAALPTTMRAWRVRRPGPMNTEPLEYVSAPVPRPGRPNSWLPCVRAACAGPIYTSPRAIFPCTGKR